MYRRVSTGQDPKALTTHDGTCSSNVSVYSSMLISCAYNKTHNPPSPTNQSHLCTMSIQTAGLTCIDKSFAGPRMYHWCHEPCKQCMNSCPTVRMSTFSGRIITHLSGQFQLQANAPPGNPLNPYARL